MPAKPSQRKKNLSLAHLSGNPGRAEQCVDLEGRQGEEQTGFPRRLADVSELRFRGGALEFATGRLPGLTSAIDQVSPFTKRGASVWIGQDAAGRQAPQ